MIGTAARTAAAIMTALAVVAARGWFKVSVAAMRLGYSARTVRRMCEDGEIPGARQFGPGAHWRIPRAWVDQQLAKSAAAVVRRPPPHG